MSFLPLARPRTGLTLADVIDGAPLGGGRGLSAGSLGLNYDFAGVEPPRDRRDPRSDPNTRWIPGDGTPWKLGSIGTWVPVPSPTPPPGPSPSPRPGPAPPPSPAPSPRPLGQLEAPPDDGRDEMMGRYLDWAAGGKRPPTDDPFTEQLTRDVIDGFQSYNKVNIPYRRKEPRLPDSRGGPGGPGIPPSPTPQPAPAPPPMPTPRHGDPSLLPGGLGLDYDFNSVRGDPRRREGPATPTKGWGWNDDDPGFMGPPEPAPNYLRQGPYPWYGPQPTPSPTPGPSPNPQPAPPPPPAPRGFDLSGVGGLPLDYEFGSLWPDVAPPRPRPSPRPSPTPRPPIPFPDPLTPRPRDPIVWPPRPVPQDGEGRFRGGY